MSILNLWESPREIYNGLLNVVETKIQTLNHLQAEAKSRSSTDDIPIRKLHEMVNNNEATMLGEFKWLIGFVKQALEHLNLMQGFREVKAAGEVC